MSPRTGRPIMGESRKDAQIGFRVTQETVEKFEECKKLSGKTKVQLFEEMVNDCHEKLSPEK